jgi:hypothetical protein
METERITLSQRERDRLKVLHEVQLKHLSSHGAYRTLIYRSRKPKNQV